MRKYFLLCVIVFFFSCKEECTNSNELTSNEKTWLCTPVAGTTQYYHDETGQTIIVTSNEAEPDVSFNSVEDCTPTVLTAQSIVFNFPGYNTDEAPVVKMEHNQPLKINIALTEFVIGFPNYHDIVLGGKSYDHVFISTVDSNLVSGISPWKIYYHAEKGILRFDLRNGKYLELN